MLAAQSLLLDAGVLLSFYAGCASPAPIQAVLGMACCCSLPGLQSQQSCMRQVSGCSFSRCKCEGWFTGEINNNPGAECDARSPGRASPIEGQSICTRHRGCSSWRCLRPLNRSESAWSM